jgi:hypothetical protein
MSRSKIIHLLDYLPLLILAVYAIILIQTVATTNIVLQSEHYTGLTFLVLTAGLFLVRHKLGVLSLGLTLLLGLCAILSYSAVLSIHSIGGSINEHAIGDIRFQAIFILWLALHFSLSHRHYTGILTKKYWRDLFDRSGAQPV